VRFSSLEFNPQHARFRTYRTTGFETINTSNSGNVNGDRGLLKAVHAAQDYISDQMELIRGDRPGDYGLVLIKGDDLVSQIDINKLALVSKRGYEVDANGTVRITFVVEHQLLGSGDAAQFSVFCPPVTNTLRIGRDLDDPLIASLGGHDRQWVRDWRDVQPQFRLRRVGSGGSAVSRANRCRKWSGT